jgi:hypothetical protein
MAPSGRDIGEQLNWHWNAQLRPGLEGLTTEEYLWEPVPAMWSVRTLDGETRVDWQWPPPDPTPVTTLGWRLCHLWMVLAQRADYHFGEASLTVDRLHWPATAEAALAAVDAAYAQWWDGVRQASDERFEQARPGPPGTIDGQFPLWSVVLHVNREVIHHGAEIALMRDLYRARHSAGLH